MKVLSDRVAAYSSFSELSRKSGLKILPCPFVSELFLENAVGEANL